VCRKKFLLVEFCVSVCVCGSVAVSDGFLGSVFAVLACASMLFSVTFYVGMRDAWMLMVCCSVCFVRVRFNS
jgi:hypothetical protein